MVALRTLKGEVVGSILGTKVAPSWMALNKHMIAQHVSLSCDIQLLRGMSAYDAKLCACYRGTSGDVVTQGLQIVSQQ